MEKIKYNTPYRREKEKGTTFILPDQVKSKSYMTIQQNYNRFILAGHNLEDYREKMYDIQLEIQKNKYDDPEIQHIKYDRAVEKNLNKISKKMDIEKQVTFDKATVEERKLDFNKKTTKESEKLKKQAILSQRQELEELRKNQQELTLLKKQQEEVKSD